MTSTSTEDQRRLASQFAAQHIDEEHIRHRQAPPTASTASAHTFATAMTTSVPDPLLSGEGSAAATASASSTSAHFNKSITEKMVVHVMAGFREVCLVTAALPLATLLFCFIGAVIFQADEVHETHCRVFNVIPSISAITGVSPQRYFWRISIALHIGPRFLIAAAYHNQYTFLLNKQRALAAVALGDQRALQEQRGARLLVTTVFWLHMVEVAALCGVTYVSNRENYPAHEKIFIAFMTCSLLHMIATIRLTAHLYPVGPAAIAASPQRQRGADSSSGGGNPLANGNNGASDSEAEHTRLIHYSLRWKRRLFWLSLAATGGMILFFVRHRWYCYDLAFSWFALSEYVIACSNLAFHCTTIWDFPGELLIVARGTGKLKAT